MPARGRRGGTSPIAPVPCPKCGGDMWDNSLTKTNPKAPDYQCKNQNCIDPESGYRTGVWARDTEKNAAQGEAATKGGAPGVTRPVIIDKLMGVCIDEAKGLLTEKLGKVEISGEATATLAINLATTMYISRTRDRAGIMSIEKDSLAAARAKAAEEAERKRIEEERRRQDEAADREGGWGTDVKDDDLPF